MLEELFASMKEFSLVGDMGSPKSLCGNGLFFLDFAQICRGSLKELAKSFFPGDKDKWKGDCELVKTMTREDVRGWFQECETQKIKPVEHP